MCGIIGVTGEPDALPVLLAALEQLEYRGYDSAGVALVADGQIWRARSAPPVRDDADPNYKRPSPVAELVKLTATRRPATPLASATPVGPPMGTPLRKTLIPTLTAPAEWP